MEDNNNNETIVVPPELKTGVVTASDGTVIDYDKAAIALSEEATKEMSQDQLAQVLATLKATQPTNFKHRFQGVAGSAKARVDMSWHNGELIPTAERNKLSWEEIHASNNVIRK